MSIRFVKARFNTNKEDDRKAYETIQKADISQSKFIIAAVNAYGSYLSAVEDKKQFCLTVQEAIHASMREIFGGGAIASSQSTVTEKPSEENGKIADDFLDNFI